VKNIKKTQYSLEIKSDRTGEKLSFGSVDGIASKNSFSEPELLIADEASPRGKTLFWRPGYGLLPVLFTGVEDVNPKAAGRSARASELTERNLRKNGREAEVRKASTPSEISERFDSAVYAPRPYSPVDLVKEKISEILKSLEEGGNIFLSGRKKTGIKRYGRMLKEMEGETEKISRGKKVLYRYEKDGEIKESFGKTEKEFIISLEDFQAETKASEDFSPQES
jgi:16S rRNA (guanine1207-N2)-methyltransferase